MKTLFTFLLCWCISLLAYGQESLDCLIKTGTPDLPKVIIRPDCKYLKVPDLYKRKEMVLADLNNQFDPLIKKEKEKLDSIITEKARIKAAGEDTTQITAALIQQEISHKNQAQAKEFEVKQLNNFMAPLIKLEYETTAYYSLPNYKGKKYLVTDTKNNAVVPFYPQSLRVARGCRIKVYPFHDYKPSKTYGTSEFKKSTKALMPNVNSGSMVSDPTVFRAVSWKLICQ